MAKHLYDKDGKYKGKILSDEEHFKKQHNEISDKEAKKRMLSYLFIFSALFTGFSLFNLELVIEWFIAFSAWSILVLISLIVFVTGIIYYSKIGWKNIY